MESMAQQQGPFQHELMQQQSLTDLLRLAREQHERLRQRFMFTSMPGLLDAAKAGDQAAAQRLLASGADPDAPVEIVYLPRNASASTVACRWTPMHFACAAGHEAVVASLLVAGARCGTDPSNSSSHNAPLTVAESHGHLRCALLLQLCQGHLQGDPTFVASCNDGVTAADSSLPISQAINTLEKRWGNQLREMGAHNAELRRRAEWAEGVLQQQVQTAAADPTQLPIEEGEAPAGEVGTPPREQEIVLGRRRVCPVCMDGPRDAAMVPCGHTACVTCASQLQTHRGACAECNLTIEMVLPLFGV